MLPASICLAVLAGCGSSPDPVAVVLPDQAALPAGSNADPLALVNGTVLIAEIREGQTQADLGRVRKGSPHVVVECDGVGLTPVAVGGIPGTFTVPCAPGGETSYNTIVFSHTQPRVDVRVVSDDQRRVRARIGWDPSLPKPPTGEDVDV